MMFSFLHCNIILFPSKARVLARLRDLIAGRGMLSRDEVHIAIAVFNLSLLNSADWSGS
jgi:hypothetical protein